MAPPTRRAATNPWRSCIKTLLSRSWLEFLLQAAVEGAPGPELGREDPEPGPVPELVLLVPEVNDVEAGGHLPDRRQGEALLDPDVGLLVRWDRRVVRVHDGAPQAAAGEEVQAEARVRRRQEVRGPRGGGDELVVIGVNEVVVGGGEVVRPEEGLSGLAALAPLLGRGQVTVGGEAAEDVRRAELDPVIVAPLVVERGVEDGCPELTVVEQVLGLLVVGVEAHLEAREDLLGDPRVEVVAALGPGDRVLGSLGLGGGAAPPL